MPNYKCQVFGYQMDIIPNFVFASIITDYLILFFSLLYGNHYVGSKKILSWIKLGATPVSGINYELGLSSLSKQLLYFTLQLIVQFTMVCEMGKCKEVENQMLFVCAGQTFIKNLFLKSLYSGMIFYTEQEKLPKFIEQISMMNRESDGHEDE